MRIASAYDTDARWGVKRDTFWLGYKLHVAETATIEPGPATARPSPGRRRGHDRDCARLTLPNLITNAAATDATVPDSQMTAVIHDELARRDLARDGTTSTPATSAPPWWSRSTTRQGIALIGPLLADTSAQAGAGQGYARADFAVDYDSRTVTCPQGKTTSPGRRAPKEARPRPWPPSPSATAAAARPGALCTAAAGDDARSPLLPRDLAEVQAAARAAEKIIPLPGRRRPPRRRRGHHARGCLPTARAAPATAACRQPDATTTPRPRHQPAAGWRHSGPAPRSTGSEPRIRLKT